METCYCLFSPCSDVLCALRVTCSIPLLSHLSGGMLIHSVRPLQCLTKICSLTVSIYDLGSLTFIPYKFMPLWGVRWAGVTYCGQSIM